MSRPRPSSKRGFRGALSLELLEDRVTPTGNIALTQLRLANAQSQPVGITPEIGEQVFIRADWTTTDIPAGSTYVLDFELNGIHLGPAAFTAGAGDAGTENWAWILGGWYAKAGTQTFTVTIDANQSVPESSFADNILHLPFTSVPAPDLPNKFIVPLAGVQGQNWNIGNYVDTDPRGGTISDFQGGTYTYDGHSGHDIGAANFSPMDAGTPEYAAAPGVVVTVQDGNFDRNSTFNNAPANFVEIDHGNGWHTFYYHMRTDTILVHVGDHVVAGQTLGLEGSSGNSTLSHLHFEVHHNGAVVEPDMDPSTFWAVTPPYQGTLRNVIDSGVTNYFQFATADLNAQERPVDANIFTSAGGQNIIVWFQGSRLQGDQANVQFFSPSGADLTTLDFAFPISAGTGGYYYVSRGLPANMQQGVWHATVSVNDVLISTIPFQVTGAGAGAAHLSQGTTYIPNGRTTPVDFGSAAPNATGPTLTFKIDNIGTATLTVGNLTFPAGFQLVGAFPSSIPVGGSADFSLQLISTSTLSYQGIVRFDMGNGVADHYSFAVKGTVTSPCQAPFMVSSTRTWMPVAWNRGRRRDRSPGRCNCSIQGRTLSWRAPQLALTVITFS